MELNSLTLGGNNGFDSTKNMIWRKPETEWEKYIGVSSFSLWSLIKELTTGTLPTEAVRIGIIPMPDDKSKNIDWLLKTGNSNAEKPFSPEMLYC